MKKHLLLTAGAAVLLLASCDKEGTNTQSFTTQMLNYITEVSPTGAATGEVVVENGVYKFSFDYNTQTVTSLCENLPSKVGVSSVTTPALTYGMNNLGNISINTKNAVTSDASFESMIIAYTPGIVPEGVTISEIPTQTFPYGYMYAIMRYTVGGEYLVRTLWPDMVFFGSTTTFYNNTASGDMKDMRYRIILNVKDKKAKMIIYDAQFAPQMPKQTALVLNDLSVSFEPNTIRISGKDVIPQYPEGGKLTPNPNFPFDKIDFFISGPSLTDGRGEFTVAGKYVGTFSGTYIQLEASK